MSNGNGSSNTDLVPAAGAAPEAPPCSASWDIFYQDGHGMECHLQLRAALVDALLTQATSAASAILDAGGRPSTRLGGRLPSPAASGSVPISVKAPAEKAAEIRTTVTKTPEAAARPGNGSGTSRPPTYMDEQGNRRCNRRLTDGSVCGQPVTSREGPYGTFWSCPNFKSHAANGERHSIA